MQRGRLNFSAETGNTVKNSQAIFVAVGTVARIDGFPDLAQIWSSADLIAASMESYKVSVIKSTVPVGEAACMSRRIAQHLSEPLEFDVVSNPEFLRQGSSVEDFLHPNRILIGSVTDRTTAIIYGYLSTSLSDRDTLCVYLLQCGRDRKG